MKRFFLWFSSFLLLVLVLIAFLPACLSTHLGNTLLLRLINKKAKGAYTVQCTKLHLSWFHTQTVENLLVEDPSGRTLLSLEEGKTKTPLLSALRRRFGTTSLQKPYLFFPKPASFAYVEGVGSFSSCGTPSKKKKPRIPTFYNRLTITEGTLIYEGNINVEQINIDYSPQEESFHIKAKTHRGELEGNVHIEGDLSSPFQITAEVDHFPIALLDQIVSCSLPTTLLGETLNARIETKERKLLATLKSTYLNGVIEGELRGGYLNILPLQSQLVYHLTPTTFTRLLGPAQRQEWHLPSSTSFAITCQAGSFPLSLKKLSLYETKFAIDMSLPRLEIMSDKSGPYSLNELHTIFLMDKELEINTTARLQGKEESKVALNARLDRDALHYTFASEGLPFALLELVFEEAALLHDFVGEQLQCTLIGSYTEEEHSADLLLSSSLIELKGNIDGELENLAFTIQGERKLFGHSQELFGKELHFALQGRAAFFESNLSLLSFTGKISNPFFAVDLQGSGGKEALSYENLRLKMEGKLLRLPGETFADIELKNNTFTLLLNGAKNELSLEGNLALSVKGPEGRIESKNSTFSLTVDDFIVGNQFAFAQGKYHFTANLAHFPLDVASPFLPEGAYFSTLMGPFIDAKIKALLEPQGKLLADVAIDAKSVDFTADINFTVDHEYQITLTEPIHIHSLLTPSKYQALMKFANQDLPPLLLAENATFDFIVNELQCPAEMPKEVRSFLCQSGLVGTLQVSPLHFKNDQKEVTIVNLGGLVRAKEFAKKIELVLTGNFQVPHLETPDPSAFSFHGEFLHLFSEEGVWHMQKPTLFSELSFDYLPVEPVTDLLPLPADLRAKTMAFLGPLVNARVTAKLPEMQGPLTIDIKSSNFKTLLPLQLSHRMITLRAPVEAELTLTEAVSRAFFVDVTPLITAAYSEHPVKLYIDPEGFSFPIYPFVFKELKVDHGVIDMGKIYVQNGIHLQELMNFLQAEEQISHDQWMEAWITPIFFSFGEGNVFYKRFDLLLGGQVHIAFWGHIDLAKDKIWMTLGIAPSTIAQKFGVVGLTKDEMFQVKIRGKSDAVEMDWSSAYTRIGILVTRLAGGQIGNLLGGVVERVLNIIGDENTPPPTTEPFPWEG